jgi:HK97 gp10 family phage protein
MPVQVTLDLAGFAAYPMAMQEALTRVVQEAAETIAADAKERAPVDTGFLRDSITSELESPLVAEVRAEADYALYVEEGHHTSAGSFVPAQPFLTPAVEAERTRFGARVRTALDEVAAR